MNDLRSWDRDVSQRFIRTFLDEKQLAGWQGTEYDDSAPGLEVRPDLEVNLMVYGALARAPVSIPDNIRIAALRHLSDLRHRSYSPAHHDVRHWVTFNDRGKSESRLLPTRVFWYPWALEALLHWLRYANQQKFPPEIQRALERSLGHVLTSGSEDMMSDMAQEPLFAVAETYYGIGSVR